MYRFPAIHISKISLGCFAAGALLTQHAFADMTVMDAMKAQMDYANQRQIVLSKNVANADTPYYKAEDLKPFDAKKMMRRHVLRMTVTSPSHMAGEKKDAGGF